MRLIPGSDIDSDYRILDVRIADLDGDDVPEIVYWTTATCVGAGFDCPNGLTVMTTLGPDDVRGANPYPGNSRYLDEDYAAIHASGYADDAGVQVPGELERIRISGNTISVTFLSKQDSPICLRVDPGTGKPTHHCPPPGRHAWRWTWAPGEWRDDWVAGTLTRVDAP